MLSLILGYLGLALLLAGAALGLAILHYTRPKRNYHRAGISRVDFAGAGSHEQRLPPGIKG